MSPTAKTITRMVAEQAFALLKDKGLLYKTITLTAKEKICFCEETECNPDVCPYAKGHFDRVNEAVFDLIANLITGTGKYWKNRRENIESVLLNCLWMCPIGRMESYAIIIMCLILRHI